MTQFWKDTRDVPKYTNIRIFVPSLLVYNIAHCIRWIRCILLVAKVRRNLDGWFNNHDRGKEGLEDNKNSGVDENK